MLDHFRLLTLKEENTLSKDELEIYYSELRKFVLNRKLTNTTPGATTLAPKLKKITGKIATAVTKMFSCKNVEWVCDGKENVPDETVLFAHSHQGILDSFVWIPTLKHHCIILLSDQISKFLRLCQYNTGLVVIKKEDKNSTTDAKLDMIQLLLKGHSMCYFPEGTWNLSPNKLHLTMKYGFLDIAKKANVPVVPVVHEFTYDRNGNITKIHTRYGEPVRITAYDDINEKLEEYKAKLSTMRYDLIEEKGVYRRADMDNYDYINYLKVNYKHLKMGNIIMEKERRNMYGSTDDFYLFHHINDVPFNENGELLDTQENQRLEKIFNREFASSKFKF